MAPAHCDGCNGVELATVNQSVGFLFLKNGASKRNRVRKGVTN
jgi:hypothetical protein